MSASRKMGRKKVIPDKRVTAKVTTQFAKVEQQKAWINQAVNKEIDDVIVKRDANYLQVSGAAYFAVFCTYILVTRFKFTKLMLDKFQDFYGTIIKNTKLEDITWKKLSEKPIREMLDWQEYSFYTYPVQMEFERRLNEGEEAKEACYHTKLEQHAYVYQMKCEILALITLAKAFKFSCVGARRFVDGLRECYTKTESEVKELCESLKDLTGMSDEKIDKLFDEMKYGGEKVC